MTSSVLLLCVPLIDVVLLAATVLDLQRGASASFAHGLAAAYIGFTVAFGGVTIQWATVTSRFVLLVERSQEWHQHTVSNY